MIRRDWQESLIRAIMFCSDAPAKSLFNLSYFMRKLITVKLYRQRKKEIRLLRRRDHDRADLGRTDDNHRGPI